MCGLTELLCGLEEGQAPGPLAWIALSAEMHEEKLPGVSDACLRGAGCVKENAHAGVVNTA